MTISPNKSKERMKEIYKQITELNRVSKQCQSPKQAVDDMMQLVFNLISQPSFSALQFPNSFVWANESLLRVLDRYMDDTQAWEILVELTNEYMALVKDSEPFTDLLSVNYGDSGLSKALGQFLTPPCVAKALPAFLGADKCEKLERGEHIAIAELCSGAGTLMLSMLEQIYQAYPNRMNQVHVVAMDLDPNMVRMTSVQIALSALVHGIELGSFEVFWGNAIVDYLYAEDKDTRGFIFTPNQDNHRALMKQFEEKAKQFIAMMEAA
ncbi:MULTISPECIES: DNA methyltransferase family protein [Burkholderia cepacia complex]|uniref:hypothetical protein n=1 Tax=Burkholderia cenocepacia TaxID=95486 RepID=UPI0022378995|nr:hypothetical protein [Burkholderia cenocepacia]MCW5156433.1 hypothetical protein [Burkholderia cenocepacia]